MIERRSPTEKILVADAVTIESAAGGKIEIAIVLGSGLASVVHRSFEHVAIPYDKLLGMPITSLAGHAGEALAGVWHGRRVLMLAGRAHLYQGFSAQQVTTSIRLAYAAGARVAILTNAAGGIDPSFEAGDLMLIADHINLTGRSPLIGTPADDPFVDMSDAYSARLRALAKRHAGAERRLREGVYAGLLGPSYETPAEVQFLRNAGAHALGMSTVLETIYARSIGVEVLGISAIANRAGTAAKHEDIVVSAAMAGRLLGDLLDRMLPEI